MSDEMEKDAAAAAAADDAVEAHWRPRHDPADPAAAAAASDDDAPDVEAHFHKKH